MVHGDNIIYVRIYWENHPSDKTPVNERNLNKMDLALHLLDERVVWLNENKFDKTESFKLVKDISLNEENGVFTITFYDNTKKQIDTILEKIAVNFDFDEERQQLIITLDDGTEKRVDLSALITQYEFLTSETISPEVESGKVKFEVREGSIQEKHLRPDYLADIRVEQGKAQLSAAKSEEFAKLSESYAHGGTGVREGEETDNAMEYARQAKESADRANNIVSGGLVTGVKGYNEDLYRTGDVSLGMHDILPRNSVNLSDVPVDNSWHDIEIEGILEGINIVKAIVWVKRREKIYPGIYTGMFNWYKQKTEISDFTEEIPLDFSGDMYVPPSQGTTTLPASRFYLRKAWEKDKFPSLQLSITRGISGLSATVELTIINLLSFLHI